MTSLLCVKSNRGIIVNENQELYEKFMREHTKTVPCLIKEKKLEDGSICDYDSYIHSDSHSLIKSNHTKSNLNSSKSGLNNSKNNVVFSIPNSSNPYPHGKDHLKTSKNSSLQKDKRQAKTKNTNENNDMLKNDFTTNSSTMISSLKDTATHSSLSSTTLNKFNSNNNLQHEKKHLSRKKLKNVQQQLDNRLNLKSAATNSFYRELNKILEDEKTLAEKINLRVERCERDKARKQEIIYKNWYRNVYEPMQSEIYNLMGSNQAEHARNLRDLKYLEYLNQCNKRTRCYQDDFEPKEYNPVDMINLDASLHENLVDPTLLTRRKESMELGLIATNSKLPVIARHESPRSDVVWNNWIMNKYNTIDSPVRIKSARKCNSRRHLSEYNLEWDRGNPFNQSISSACKSKQSQSEVSERSRAQWSISQ